MLYEDVGAGRQRGDDDDDGEACGERDQSGSTPPPIPPRLLRHGVESYARPNIGTSLRDTVIDEFFGRPDFCRGLLLLVLRLGAVDLALSSPLRLRRVGFGGFNEFGLPTQFECPSTGTGGGGESFSLGGFGVC